MDNLTLPEVGLDYAGAMAQASPHLGFPEMLLPPEQQAVLDAIAMSSKRKMTTDGFLTGALNGESVQEQTEKALGGSIESWEAFNKKQDQGPDLNAAMQQLQQASVGRPQMEDLGRPKVDQTQQFIASLGALFDPKNAGQIMDLPQQNAQVDYEYKVKDAMRRYQMNNQDYEAKVELAKMVYENTVREAAQVRGDNRAAYGQYAADKRSLDAIRGRADVAITKEQAKLAQINAQLIGKSKQQLMIIALQAADPLERKTAATKIYELDGTVVTPPQTTGAEQKLKQTDRGLDIKTSNAETARNRANAVIESSKWKNRLTQEQIATLKEKGKYIKADALSRIAQRQASINNYASMIGSRSVRDGIASQSLDIRKNGQGIQGLRGELYQSGATVRALDKQIAAARDDENAALVAELQDERQLHLDAYNDAKGILEGIYSRYNLKVPIKPGKGSGTTGNKDLDFILGFDGKSNGTLPAPPGQYNDGGLDPNKPANPPTRPGGKRPGGKSGSNQPGKTKFILDADGVYRKVK